MAAQRHRWCLPCKAAHQRAWRKTHPLNPEQRRKANARSYAHVYLKRGWLARQACRRCSAPHAQMHHPDYSNPLWVHWLCRECHREHHKT